MPKRGSGNAALSLSSVSAPCIPSESYITPLADGGESLEPGDKKGEVVASTKGS